MYYMVGYLGLGLIAPRFPSVHPNRKYRQQGHGSTTCYRAVNLLFRPGLGFRVARV